MSYGIFGGAIHTWEPPVLWVSDSPSPFAASRASFRSWLGCAPIAADQIGKAVWHPLWLSLRPRLRNSPMDLRKILKEPPRFFPKYGGGPVIL